MNTDSTTPESKPNGHADMQVYVPRPREEEANPTPALRFVGDPKSVAALFEAIAKARKEFGSVTKGREGQIGNQRFKYSPLGTLTDASMAPLCSAGVVPMQFITASPTPGHERLTTLVAGHGARIESYIDFKPDPSVQLYGKQTTYLRRYAYNALFVLDGVPDQDEKGGLAPPESRPVSDGQNATIAGLFNKIGFDKNIDARVAYAEKVIGKPVDDFMYLDAEKLIKHLGAQVDSKKGAQK